MSESASGAASKQRGKRRGVLARVVLFTRQVVAELRKVVWPTRSELGTYFVVVVFFILAIMLFTGVLDLAFNRAVTWLFT
ncbi:preprotein translocase subunit SecE [Actinomyces sp. 2119]|uniref:Protein translocase subunit SecE n=1 Tax=Actinomyces lilanjuaniae TaxID=2321394 RepID=A0ABM6Z1X0_9ACTO|nr:MULTISPECIES: preprotein translocase subunit SecE [Actinomyces]AYD89291.1 preprotein translocase subunit SecE [Actinomyces lilanjuaniae]RJF40708.1 preprotein translocase subunit SecE [Actinomyces sp. 2119]